MITELARAKVNLTLEVLGRRPDGYHELASLVAFAEIGDLITLDPDVPLKIGDAADAVTISGPFATSLVGENLIITTLQRLAAVAPGLQIGPIHLAKHLPVAAGIGGGSADAAAMLRAVRHATAGQPQATAVPWAAIAASLGADVPVCVASRACWMTGTGGALTALPGLPTLDVVLVNSLGPVPADKTAQVFRALNAPALAAQYRPEPLESTSDWGFALATASHPVPSRPAATSQGTAKAINPAPGALGDVADATADHPPADTADTGDRRRLLLDQLRRRGNHLEVATRVVVPAVADVLDELARLGTAGDPTGGNEWPRAGQPTLPSEELARPLAWAMSGAGPTCFALFASAAAAKSARDHIRRRHPTWWVVATQIC
jgi:4-diphosphocytidyl-2-C-methyl-D-erythritol kinase